MKRSKHQSAAGLVLESNEPQDHSRKIVYLLCLPDDLPKLKQMYDNHLRLVRTGNNFLGIWLYLEEFKPIIKDQDVFYKHEKDPVLLTIRFLQKPYICKFWLGTVQGNTYGIVKKAFFWQTWIGAQFHKDPTLKTPISIMFQWGDRNTGNSFGTDKRIVFTTQVSNQFTFSSQKFMIEKLHDALERKDLELIKSLKDSGLLYDLAKFAKHGIRLVTRELANDTFEDTLFFTNSSGDFEALDRAFAGEALRWIRNTKKYVTEDASLYCDIDMSVVNDTVANYARRVPEILDQWKTGDYKGINKAAFNKQFNPHVLELDRYLHAFRSKFHDHYNVFRAYWPKEEADDRQQRGPDLQTLIPGQIIDVNGFLATAYRLPPRNFLGSSCCLMIIKVKPTIPCIVLDNDVGALGDKDMRSEHEILFPMGMQLQFRELKIMLADGRSVEVAMFDMLYSGHLQVMDEVFNSETSTIFQRTMPSMSHRPELVFAQLALSDRFDLVLQYFPTINPFTELEGSVMKMIMSSPVNEQTLSYYANVHHMFVNDEFWLAKSNVSWIPLLLKNPKFDPLNGIDNFLNNAWKMDKAFIILQDARIQTRFEIVYQIYMQSGSGIRLTHSDIFKIIRQVLKDNKVLETKRRMIELCTANDWRELEKIDSAYFKTLDSFDFNSEEGMAQILLKSSNCISLFKDKKVPISALSPLFFGLAKYDANPSSVIMLMRMSNDWDEFPIRASLAQVLQNKKLNAKSKEYVLSSFLGKSSIKGHLFPNNLTLTGFAEILQIMINVAKTRPKKFANFEWLKFLQGKIEELGINAEQLQPLLEEFEFVLKHAK